MRKFSAKKIYFAWNGKTADGRLVRGQINASNLALARMHLTQKGIRIKTIKKQTFFYLYWQRRKTITESMILAFLKQLTTLISAGIPILHCFTILQDTHSHFLLHNLILECKKEISIGKTLSGTFKHFPTYFDKMTCHLIFIGEQSGTLEQTLKTLTDYKEKTLALKKQLFQALLYPLLVFTTALIISLVMLIFIVPKFEELFVSMHAPLPAFTQGVVNISHGLRNMGWIVILFLMIGPWVLRYLQKSIRYKIQADILLLNTPVIGGFVEKIICARFCRHFASLFSAGISVIESLKMIAPIMHNHIYTQAIQSVQREITQGEHLYQSMQKHFLFPPLMIQMIKIGEESGLLEKMLFKLAIQYEQEVEYWLNQLNHLLEPLIMLILGVLIGGLVIAMYLPIFKLGTII